MIRVLPRDAFNDANLLKCIAQLTMLIEDGAKEVEGLSFEYDGEPFDIQQDPADGSTYVTNIRFFVGKKQAYMRRALNSRDAWPLIMTIGLDDEYYVFSSKGEIQPAFKQLAA